MCGAVDSVEGGSSMTWRLTVIWTLPQICPFSPYPLSLRCYPLLLGLQQESPRSCPCSNNSFHYSQRNQTSNSEMSSHCILEEAQSLPGPLHSIQLTSPDSMHGFSLVFVPLAFKDFSQFLYQVMLFLIPTPECTLPPLSGMIFLPFASHSVLVPNEPSQIWGGLA